MDALYLALMALFFASIWALARVCARLQSTGGRA